MRSRAAASILADAGIKDVYNMSGGINAWEGITAEGIPESGMAFFRDSDSPNELVSLAWQLEDGSGRFYRGVSGMLEDKESADLFNELVNAEEHHKAVLVSLYKEIAGSESSHVLQKNENDIMEGGMKVSEALEWARGKDAVSVLELSMSLEANAYDLYIRMGRRMKDSDSKKIFDMLAGEEKKHLEKMASLLERKV